MRGTYGIPLLATLLVFFAAAATAGERRQLTFVVSYQGLFTAGLEVDIGRIDLQLEATDSRQQEVLMRASTRDFDTAELIMPVRFCYRSRQDSVNGGTRQADWWSRIGGKASRGRLLVDRERQRVLRLHSERKLEQTHDEDDGILPAWAAPATIDQDRDEAPFPAAGVPLDRLGMIQHLRRRPLAVGEHLKLPATNGRQLVGYRIEVEAEEEVLWNQRPLKALRLRLQPLEQGDSKDRPSWLWLSTDEQRLPLRMRSTHPHGSFEMRLANDGYDSGVQCPVPEAVELELPAA